MRLLRNMSRSTALLLLVALVAISAGAGVLVSGRAGRLPATSNHVSGGPSSTKGPVGLQVIMGGGDASSTADSQASSGAEAGPAGPEGPAGADGLDGADGAPGADGVAGADGATGPEGSQGPDGSVGATGPAGSVGATGPAGSVGATGPAGSVGETGPAGAGLTPVDSDGGGFELRSPDGVSYSIHVTNHGIIFQGPSTTEVWSDTSHFQTLVP